MDENEAQQPDDVMEHPLLVGYHQWVESRCHNQTKTTLKAIDEARAKGDVELLETYDRLLGEKGGAWIKYVVKAVRKKPELGTVAGITIAQVHAYTDMRKTVNANIYGQGSAKKLPQFGTHHERDRTDEYALFDFAISHPDQVPSVCAVINDRGFLELDSILALIASIKESHPAISEGAL